ncbi:hypothetical protein [Gimesia maris]|uniref:hypothetical protein n=1 Tax=Gimesia maris TaxID=122 RepID=UPI000E9CF92B|nr:hypothetical protein [Gimesia maris]HAW27882.1 hypothetical protein [Planctomycetaceae bacterium]|tara:strand:- start:420 stop:818 length:399 start_codon:yes stop_codon:yes gene_type:complete
MSATTLTIRDETMAGKITGEITLEFLTENITVRELIRSRVYQEVKDFNAKQTEHFRGLIQPTDTEETLNGFKLKKSREIDWHEQFAKAVEAFERNQILILVNERQAESLDEEITITPQSEVSFLKLTLLVGG